MRFYGSFFLLRLVYPKALFRIRTTDKVLCLTFDDGPDPGSTPLILDILEARGVKAVFFCRGKLAERYPGLISLIKSRGHVVGNHGYNHLDGLKTIASVYLRDFSLSAEFTSHDLLRPPYGRIGPVQYRELAETGRIVFWDLMPYDFDYKMTGTEVLRILRKRIRPGSIIVLHDNANSMANSVIKDFIEFAIHGGYRFTIYSD